MSNKWTVTPDAAGDLTLWDGDTAVLRQRIDIDAPDAYRDLLWSVLTAVLAPDEATVERLARVSHDAVIGSLPDRYKWDNLREGSRDVGRAQMHIVLAALSGARDADTEAVDVDG